MGTPSDDVDVEMTDVDVIVSQEGTVNAIEKVSTPQLEAEPDEPIIRVTSCKAQTLVMPVRHTVMIRGVAVPLIVDAKIWRRM